MTDSTAIAGTAGPPARVRNLTTILVAASAITAISLGVRSTFGLFLGPMTTALHTNRAGFALAIAIQNLVWGLAQPVAGGVADRFGASRVLAVGGAAYGVGVLLMSQATTTTGLYVGGGLIVGLGMAAASFSVVLAAVGRLAPPQRRTWAMGVATAAGSMGQFVLVQLVGRLQGGGKGDSWRSALLVMAVVAVAIVAFTRPLRGRSPRSTEAPTEHDSDRETLGSALRRAFHHRPYVLLCIGFFVCGFHITFIGTHLPSYLADVGLSRSTGTRALAAIGLFNVIGSFAAGALGARYSRARLLSLVYGLRALAMVGLVLTPHTASTALVFAAVMGVLWLATVPLTSAIVVAQFGVRHAGSLFGFVFLSHQIGAFVGVWYGGKLADSVGSYTPVWWIAAALGVGAAVLHLFVKEGPAPRPPARVVGSSPVGLRPAAGLAAVVLLAGLVAWGAAHTAGAPLAGAATASGALQEGPANAPALWFCPLHPAG